MPSFFHFTQGTETRARNWGEDASPLLGRFRAMPMPQSRRPPNRRRLSQLGLLSSSNRGSVHCYGSFPGDLFDQSDGDGYAIGDDDENSGKLARIARWVQDVWVDPTQSAVKKVVGAWYSRWGTLVVLPAALAISWCAIPLPQYPLPDNNGDGQPDKPPEHKAPGHGVARVQVNFWFFLFVYYGFYNLVALIWITKVFNIYSLNWWPKTLGFPLTISLLAILSFALPVPVYLHPATKFLTVHNTAWISWTFIVMALPVVIAFVILTLHERHLSLGDSISETQRIFTSSYWTTDGSVRRPYRLAGDPANGSFDPETALDMAAHTPASARGRGRRGRGSQYGSFGSRRWLPASFVRFVWFCVALFIGFMVYVMGEAYAEMYLRTLPHNNLETLVYVYSWVATVHLLDALTGWILGGNDGERVGSYPLSWIFKLYFMLTYQTYVRALYARLRSPQQFILLQAISSSLLIIFTPIAMSATFHRILWVLGFNGQSYGAYQKVAARNVFIRGIAENVSMLAFLGSVLVLHFGANKNVYPYFAFDFEDEPYDFNLTFYASSITWACELAAHLVLRGLVRVCFDVDVGKEGKLDLAVWPELLPTSVAVMLHVLQNMLFSIIRLQFR